MLEALRQRFVPDRLLRRIPERGARECSPEVYLEGLTEQNRQQVVQFVKFTQSLREKAPWCKNWSYSYWKYHKT